MPGLNGLLPGTLLLCGLLPGALLPGCLLPGTLVPGGLLPGVSSSQLARNVTNHTEGNVTWGWLTGWTVPGMRARR